MEGKVKVLEGIIEQFEPVLKKLKDERVFDLKVCNEEEINIFEMCDECFGTELTADECMALGTMFAALGLVMKGDMPNGESEQEEQIKE